MNNKRRRALNQFSAEAFNLQTRLQYIIDEEQESYDNLPESLQESSKGADIETAIDDMEKAYGSLTEFREHLLAASM